MSSEPKKIPAISRDFQSYLGLPQAVDVAVARGYDLARLVGLESDDGLWLGIDAALVRAIG